MNGGKLIGQGTFGCIFSPAPRCMPGGPEGPEYIGKVFKKKEYTIDELRIAKLLQKIDPKQHYFIYPTHECTTRMKDIAQDPDAEQCDFIGMTKTEPDHEFAMVVMPKINSSMIRLLMIEKIRPRDYALAIIPIFKGIELLAKNKIVHNDIKFDNLLYDGKDRVFKIIDFGISVNFKSAFLPKDNEYIDVDYWLHPPEYRIWSYLRKHEQWPKPLPDNTIREVFKKHMNLLNLQMTKEINIRRLLLELHNYCDYERGFIEWVRALTKNSDPVKYINKYAAARIDTYCMGMNIMICLKFLDRTQDQEIYNSLVNLVTLLTHADPRKRPSANDCVKMLSAISSKP